MLNPQKNKSRKNKFKPKHDEKSNPATKKKNNQIEADKKFTEGNRKKSNISHLLNLLDYYLKLDLGACFNAFLKTIISSLSEFFPNTIVYYQNELKLEKHVLFSQKILMQENSTILFDRLISVFFAYKAPVSEKYDPISSALSTIFSKFTYSVGNICDFTINTEFQHGNFQTLLFNHFISKFKQYSLEHNIEYYNSFLNQLMLSSNSSIESSCIAIIIYSKIFSLESEVVIHYIDNYSYDTKKSASHKNPVLIFSIIEKLNLFNSINANKLINAIFQSSSGVFSSVMGPLTKMLNSINDFELISFAVENCLSKFDMAMLRKFLSALNRRVLDFPKVCRQLRASKFNWLISIGRIGEFADLLCENDIELQNLLVTKLINNNPVLALDLYHRFKLSSDNLLSRIRIPKSKSQSKKTPLEDFLGIDIPYYFISNDDSFFSLARSDLLSAQCIGLDLEFLTGDILLSQNFIDVPEIIQLSSSKNCFIFDLKYLDDKMNSLFESIFSSLTILKVGMRFDEDLKKLQEFFPLFSCFKKMNNYLELMRIESRILKLDPSLSEKFASLSINKESKKDDSKGKVKPRITGGLAGLIEFFLNKKLDKTEQISNWERRPLTPAQLKYAALDSYCEVLLVENFYRRGYDLSAIVNKPEKIHQRHKKYKKNK